MEEDKRDFCVSFFNVSNNLMAEQDTWSWSWSWCNRFVHCMTRHILSGPTAKSGTALPSNSLVPNDQLDLTYLLIYVIHLDLQLKIRILIVNITYFISFSNIYTFLISLVKANEDAVAHFTYHQLSTNQVL